MYFRRRQFAALLILVAGAAFSAGQENRTSAAALPAEPGYDYHFGPNPYLPSQAKANFEGFLKPSDFPTAAYCGKCHEDVHQQWRESAHANSFRAPFYLKNVEILIDSKGIEYSRHCEGCHNPEALFTGALTKGSKVDRSFDADGITCMVCHSIAKIQNTSGTGSYVMGRPTVMLNPDGSPRYDLPSYDEIFAHPELHARAVMKDFYKTPEFCATCHKAALPKIINDYKWLRAFSVYDEWQNSSWSKRSPLPFYKKDVVSVCQTCHMPPVPAKTDYGAKKGMVASHRWPAANTAIPFYYGFDQQLKVVEDFLRDNRFGIDFFMLAKNDAEQPVAPLDRQNFTIAPGDAITVGVVIQNKGIGHSLVPEQRDFYESWVEFDVRDAKGKTIYSSGYLNPDGTLEPEAHSYTNRLISQDDQLLMRHQVWETRAKAYDNTIPPGRSDLVRYQFHVPKEVAGPLTVTVKVNYRRFRKDYTDFILGKSVEYPVVDMAEKSMQLKIGQNAPAATVPDPNEYLRWNNYGIALLDQQQYWLSAAAFQKAAQLKPDYVDAYVNIAIADYTGERYDEARQALAKALQMDPAYPRALYYQALLDRRNGDLDGAAKKLEQVIAAFPQLRDARDELGNIYYIQKKYAQARVQYEAIQNTIDPDDLSAHHHLSLIYARLGMRDKAAQQAAYFADERNDPSALNYALQFFKGHPNIARESVPWHLHSDRPQPPTGAPQPSQGTEAQ
jgi:Tfp pilus assembly protein PilF